VPPFLRSRHCCPPQKTLTLMIQTATRVHHAHHRLRRRPRQSARLLTHYFSLALCDVDRFLFRPLATVTVSRHVTQLVTTVSPQLHSPPLTSVSSVRRQQLLALSTQKHQSSLRTLHSHSPQSLTVMLPALHHQLSSSITAHFRPQHTLLMTHRTIWRLLSKQQLILRLNCLSMSIYCSCKL